MGFKRFTEPSNNCNSLHYFNGGKVCRAAKFKVYRHINYPYWFICTALFYQLLMKTPGIETMPVLELKKVLSALELAHKQVSVKFNFTKNKLLNDTGLGYYQVIEQQQLLKNHGAAIKANQGEQARIKQRLKKIDLDYLKPTL